MPPLAAAVCERVGKTFVMQAVCKPAATQPRVARKPAPPAPMITTSYVWSVSLYAEPTVVIIADEDMSAPAFCSTPKPDVASPLSFQTINALPCPLQPQVG